MQAVILAGGLGRRLLPVTLEIPKPMVPVAGVPYLEHQLRYLKVQDIVDIVVCTGYLGEQIETYFGDGAALGLSIQYSRESEPIGTGGALRLASGLLAPEFLVVYGDSFLPIDYREVTAGLTRAEGVVTVYDNRLADTSVANNIAIDRDSFVVRYAKTSAPDPQLQYVEAGVLAFCRRIVGLIPQGVAVSLEQDVFPELIARRQLLAYATRQRFFDIGTAERLRIFEDYLTA